MKKTTILCFIAHILMLHHNTSGMLFVKSLNKYPKTKLFLSQQYCRTPWTHYRLSYEDLRCLEPLFSAHEELYQVTTKNHAEHNALLKQIVDNQNNILKYQHIISQRLDTLEKK